MDILFEEIDFQVNDQYEQIIEDLQKKKYRLNNFSNASSNIRKSE